MKRHIIFACIYEYVCTMVMKKFTFLLITLFSSTLILLADNPYRSYTVADGLSNSTVKAIYQDEMGYIWLGTKDGLNRLDGYEIKNFFYESDETVRQSNDIVSITGDRQGRMWIGTFNGITLFDPFEEKYIDLATLYKGCELPRGVVVGLSIASDGAVWVVTKMGVYILRNGKCTCLEALRGLYINSMAPSADNSLLLNVANKGILRLDTRTSRFSYILKGPDYPAFLKIFQDEKERTWLASSLDNLQLYNPVTSTATKIEVNFPADMSVWKGQVHDIKVYNDSLLLLATDNGLAVMNEHTHVISRTFEECIPSGLLANRRLMSLYKDKQGSLWLGTFNEGALFYNARQYLFRYHRQTVSAKTIGILYARKQNVRYGCQPDLRKYTECHLPHIQYHPERTGKADKGLSQDHPFYGIHHTPHHGRSVRYGRSRYPFAAERGMVAFHSFLPTALSWRLLHHTDCHQQ